VVATLVPEIVSPPRLTRELQIAPDTGLHQPPVLCNRGTSYFPRSLPLYLKSTFLYAICQVLFALPAGLFRPSRLRSFQKGYPKGSTMLTSLTFAGDVWYCFDVPIKQALIKSPRLDIVAHINRDGVFRCVQDRHWDFYPGVVALFLSCRIYSSTPRE
jgi:hypothetical protein